MDKLRKKKYYIKLDLCRIYNFIYIKDGEEWKIVFWTKYGYYEYMIMLFGLINVLVTM